MRSRPGFTLTELLIVIAIVGILTGLGAGAMRGMLDRGRLQEAVSILRHQVEEGRRLAKRLDRNVTVTISASGNSWSVVVDGRTRELPQGVVIAPAAATTLVFDAPFGTYAGNDVALTVSLRDASRTVTITGVMARAVVQ